MMQNENRMFLGLEGYFFSLKQISYSNQFIQTEQIMQMDECSDNQDEGKVVKHGR